MLATRDQGTNRAPAQALSKRVRSDGRFELVERWPWTKKRQVELWRRKATAPRPQPFDQHFIALARGMAAGPSALTPIFASIGPWHLLDPTFSYQDRVRRQAQAQLRQTPSDRDALWSLARLEALEGAGGWASAYRSVVLLADWQTCRAARISPVPTAHAAAVLTVLRDLGRSLCFDPRGPLGLATSLPEGLASLRGL